MFNFKLSKGGSSFNDSDVAQMIEDSAESIKAGAHMALDAGNIACESDYRGGLAVKHGSVITIDLPSLVSMLERLDNPVATDINALISVEKFLDWRCNYRGYVESYSSIDEEISALKQMGLLDAGDMSGGVPYDLLLDRPLAVGLSENILSGISRLQTFVVNDLARPFSESGDYVASWKKSRDLLKAVICHDLRTDDKFVKAMEAAAQRGHLVSDDWTDHYRFDVDGLCECCSYINADLDTALDEWYKLLAYAQFREMYADACQQLFDEEVSKRALGS